MGRIPPCLSMIVRVVLVHCLILSLFISDAANSDDQDALLVLKDHVINDPSNFLSKYWNTSTSICNWRGVSCDVHSHRVTALNLSLLSLTGKIPFQLGNLSSLQTLDLSVNQFSGTIPSSIFTINTLKLLNLTENHLSGPLTYSISNMSSLRVLELGYNRISGEIPPNICNYLPLLDTLGLHGNTFHGKIPKEIGNLTKLKGLNLGENKLQGEIPHEIGNLFNLEFLVLHHNKLVGVVPVTIFNMSTLQVIQLPDNSLSGTLPSSADNRLPNLVSLNLWGNNFSGTIPSFIFNASKLFLVDLSDNSFSGFIPSTFGNLRNLERLNLHTNYLKSSNRELSFLSSLSNCKHLEGISFTNNPLNGILPRVVGNLSHSLEIISMADCNISGGIPEEISNLTNLIVIDLPFNKLNGSIPKTLGRLHKLQAFRFQNNKLEGSIPNDICFLTALYGLSLYINQLSGSIPACLGNLTALRILVLGSNKLTSTIPSTLWSLRYILHLDLSSNLLIGPLPLEIGNLKVLLGLNLSMNNLSGVIPTTIGGLKDMQNLSLEYNRLQGPIPDSFGDLISLKYLNLSHNNLCGAIPVSLEKLLDLKYLDLSFNKLEGEIPKGGSFVNFSAKSFMENDLLCGSPNLQVPPCRTTVHRTSRKNVLILGIVLSLSTIFIIVVILLISLCRKRGKRLPNDATMSLEETWRRFSYLELFRATGGFSENNLIGRGSFGCVYKARLKDEMEVAVKVFHLQHEGAFKSFDAECDMMKNIRHRNLVKIISTCSTEDFKALVIEYMPNGSLEKCLYSNNNILDIFQRLNIMIDVASAMEYLHFGYSAPVIHCDLKPSNVLLDENMIAHLSDFGISKLLNGDDQSMTQTQTLATTGYMAPEYGREGQVSTKVDVYSFGIMLMETFTGKKPTHEIFIGEITLRRWVNDVIPISIMELVDANLLKWEDDHYVAKEKCVSSILNLAMECTVAFPDQRINAKEIVIGLSKIRDSLLRNTGSRRMRQLELV